MPGQPPRLRAFASRQDLADTLAAEVAGRLDKAIGERGGATLAVSGGTTPARFFGALSRQEIDWPKVAITLVDERCVAAASDRSNEGLVRRLLLRDRAAGARFLPLYSSEPDPAAAAHEASERLAALPGPFDVVVLGMGTDGHTASFFPDAPELARLLDPAGRAVVDTVSAPSAGEPRLTLTLPQIARARAIVLHIEGAEKRSVLEAALGGTTRPPIRAVLEQAERAPEIFWAA